MATIQVVDWRMGRQRLPDVLEENDADCAGGGVKYMQAKENCTLPTLVCFRV